MRRGCRRVASTCLAWPRLKFMSAAGRLHVMCHVCVLTKEPEDIHGGQRVVETGRARRVSVSVWCGRTWKGRRLRGRGGGLGAGAGGVAGGLNKVSERGWAASSKMDVLRRRCQMCVNVARPWSAARHDPVVLRRAASGPIRALAKFYLRARTWRAQGLHPITTIALDQLAMLLLAHDAISDIRQPLQRGSKYGTATTLALMAQWRARQAKPTQPAASGAWGYWGWPGAIGGF